MAGYNKIMIQILDFIAIITISILGLFLLGQIVGHLIGHRLGFESYADFFETLRHNKAIDKLSDGKIYEVIPNADEMLPTSPPGDDGKGWKRVNDYDTFGELVPEYMRHDSWQREVKTGSCPGDEWTEGTPGVWHKSR